jgi:hypothetical protein
MISKPWRSTRLGRRSLREYVRDRAGRVLGYIEDMAVGNRIEARDLNGRVQAYYDKRADETRLPDGRVVGRGNLPALPGPALMQIVWSILRLLFWAAITALRRTFRLVIGVLAWSAGAYVGYKLVRHRARD